MYGRNPAKLDLSLCKRVKQPSQFVHCLIVRMEFAKARANAPIGRLIGRYENIENVGAFVGEWSQSGIPAITEKAIHKILMLPSQV